MVWLFDLFADAPAELAELEPGTIERALVAAVG